MSKFTKEDKQFLRDTKEAGNLHLQAFQARVDEIHEAHRKREAAIKRLKELQKESDPESKSSVYSDYITALENMNKASSVDMVDEINAYKFANKYHPYLNPDDPTDKRTGLAIGRSGLPKLQFGDDGEHVGNYMFLKLMTDKNHETRKMISDMSFVSNMSPQKIDTLQQLFIARAEDQAAMTQLYADKVEEYNNDKANTEKRIAMELASQRVNIAPKYISQLNELREKGFSKREVDNIQRLFTDAIGRDPSGTNTDYSYIANNIRGIRKAHDSCDVNFAKLYDANLSVSEAIHYETVSNRAYMDDINNKAAEIARQRTGTPEGEELPEGAREKVLDEMFSENPAAKISRDYMQTVDRIGKMKNLSAAAAAAAEELRANDIESQVLNERFNPTPSEVINEADSDKTIALLESAGKSAMEERANISDAVKEFNTSDVGTSLATAEDLIAKQNMSDEELKETLDEAHESDVSSRAEIRDILQQDNSQPQNTSSPITPDGFTPESHGGPKPDWGNMTYAEQVADILDKNRSRYTNGYSNNPMDMTFYQAQQRAIDASKSGLYRKRLTNMKLERQQKLKEYGYSEDINTDSFKSYMETLFKNIKAELKADGAFSYFDTNQSVTGTALANKAKNNASNLTSRLLGKTYPGPDEDIMTSNMHMDPYVDELTRIDELAKHYADTSAEAQEEIDNEMIEEFHGVRLSDDVRNAETKDRLDALRRAKEKAKTFNEEVEADDAMQNPRSSEQATSQEEDAEL